MAGQSTLRVLSEAPAPPMANKRRKISPGHQHEATAKRKRFKLQLISLPTDILCSILSKLPFKEAVRTSALSTQWKHVWCGRTKLDFSYTTVLTNSVYKISANWRSIERQWFIQRVSSVLRQHDGIGIEQLRVVHPLSNEYSDHVDEWVNYAVESKAKELILVLSWPGAPPGALPYDFCFQSFNTNGYTYLRSLQLSFVSLRLPADFTGFPNLTKLNLEDVNVTDEDARRLLSTSNLLVSLRIVGCKTITSVRTRHLNQLKHLHVQACPLVQEIELNCGVMYLDYRGGPMIPMALAASPGLTNICFKLSSEHSAVFFIFTEIPNTLHHLEVLTLRCMHIKVCTATPILDFYWVARIFVSWFLKYMFLVCQRAASPRRLIKFNSVRHLRLEIVLRFSIKTIDMLDMACLLEAAPCMENLELHMVMNRGHQRYHVEDGELRRLPSYSHHHLIKVKITGFYGQRDQLELALHILRSATMLREMKIETRPTVHELGKVFCGSVIHYRDGYNVASEFLAKEDHNNAVHIFDTSKDF